MLVCEHCGGNFWRKRRGAKNKRRFCSTECGNKARINQPAPGFVSPNSTRAERVRANGLINRRLKLGWFEKPKACMKCGKSAKLDSHHTDYSKPDQVYWLCRSCHTLSHHHADFLNGIAPFICDEKIPFHVRHKPVKHVFHGNQFTKRSPAFSDAKQIGGAR